MSGEWVNHGLNRDIPGEIRNFRVMKSGTSGFPLTLLTWHDLRDLAKMNASFSLLDVHNNFGTFIPMEISQNFGGKKFYPL